MNNLRTHKIIAFFLAILMILPVIPTMDLTVFAEGSDPLTWEGKKVKLVSSSLQYRLDPNIDGYMCGSSAFPAEMIVEKVQQVGSVIYCQLRAADGFTWDVNNTWKVPEYCWLESRHLELIEDEPETPEEGSITIKDDNGNTVSSLTMNKYDKPVLKATSSQGANTRYAWQIEYAPGQWVDIYGEDSAIIKLSYGMVASLLDANSSVNVRCKSIVGDETVYSEPVSVTVYETSSSSMSIPRAFADDITEETTSASTTIYTVVINYVFADGRQAANPWTATIEAGGDFTGTISSPKVIGYTPDKSEINLEIVDIAGDLAYTVTYSAAEVDFVVEHTIQNTDDEDYTVHKSVAHKGYTDSFVGDGLAMTATECATLGVYALPYDIEQKIAADGTTKVVIMYDRYYYLMKFDLSGGYGVEPIYARVDTDITVGTPIRAGYSFVGWSPSIPDKMPAKDVTITALWEPGNTTYTVVYWAENANDNGYSFWSYSERGAVSGSTVSGSDDFNGTTELPKAGFHFDHADQNVTVKGDGSTVVNVYYKRNTYTLTFAYEGGPLICDVHVHSNECYELICTKTEHEHSHEECCTSTYHSGTSRWCNTNKCPNNGEEHTHSNSCYNRNEYICGKTGVSNHTHGVSNGCYGVKFEGIKYGQDTSYWWNQAPVYRWKTTYSGNTAYTYAPAMPNSNLTVYGQSLSSSYKYTIHYYEEGTTNKVHEDNVYYRNGTGYYLTQEDYIEIPGFECLQKTDLEHGGDLVYEIYYRRKIYALTFKNGNETIDAGSFPYEDDISGKYYVPTYNGDDPEGYAFGGWYTTEACVPGTEWNHESAKMPYNNLILYAKWVPVTHDVKLYITKADWESGNQYLDTITVPHNTVAQEPARPSNGRYRFVGWFYMENGVEKAFDFEIPVRKDLNLYGKWTADELATYTIKYAVRNADGTTLTYIADDTTGSALAGTDKTFEAKPSTALNEGYRTGYYPETNSHSMNILLDAENTYTFIYVPKDEVKYTVKYLEEGTENVLAPQKDGVTREAIHTENFVYIQGYRPDAYQKRLVLSANESENVITFWYSADTTHAPVLVKHYLQNIEGDGYNTDSPYLTTTDLDGVIGQVYPVDIITNITGFEFKTATAKANNNAVEITIGGTTVSATVTEYGLLIELYYDRVMCPYEFQFLEQGTNKPLADPLKGTARYGAQVTQAAYNISGYSCNVENHAITIQLEDGTTAVKNLRVFYYVERIIYINYVAVGGGTVEPDKETVFMATPTAKGSTPKANPGYKFVGWYLDSACEDKDKVTIEYGLVDSTTQMFVPYPTKVQEMVNPTFYAKFVEIEVTINYVAVGPTGATNFGTVTPDSEKLGAATGVANGSVADPNDPTFKFVGWYSNEACTNFITADAAIKPTKAADALWIDGTTYYAKFEYNLTSLTITKTGWDSVDPNQTFIFNVLGGDVNVDVTIHGNDSVTIYGLTVGQSYTITEKTNWSWRYVFDSWTYTIGGTQKDSKATNGATIILGEKENVITFVNTRSQKYWLDGDSWCDNIFKPVSK